MNQGVWEEPSLLIFEAASGLEGDINSLNKVVECTRRKRPSSYFGFLKEGAPRSWVDKCLGIAMDLALHMAYHFPSSRDSPTHDPPLLHNTQTPLFKPTFECLLCARHCSKHLTVTHVTLSTTLWGRYVLKMGNSKQREVNLPKVPERSMPLSWKSTPDTLAPEQRA